MTPSSDGVSCRPADPRVTKVTPSRRADPREDGVETRRSSLCRLYRDSIRGLCALNIMYEPHIFVVEDDPSVTRQDDQLSSSDRGFEVQAFTSSVDALANLADHAIPYPQAIVLDLNMPEMDGREFYR